MSVSVQQAANNALAAWLTTSLTGSPKVDARWADPTRIFSGGTTAQRPIAVSIVLAGRPVDQFLDTVTNPVVVSGIRYRQQPIRLDVWAAYDVDRDDLVAQLDILFSGRGGPSVDATVAASLGVIDHGVVLALADGFTSRYAGFVFDIPIVSDDADSAGRSLYRATYMGNANMVVEIP